MPESVAVQQPEEIVVEHISEIGSALAARPAVLPSPDQPVGPGSILQLLDKAMERGVDVQALKGLQEILERVSDRAAAREFAAALAAFQEDCPPITKNRDGQKVKGEGNKAMFRYADLDHITRTIRPHLRQHGLTFTHDTRVEGKSVTTTCTLRHVGGHAVTASIAVPAESSAGMSEQQKYSSALMMARRLSLIQVLGLTTTDQDDDGANPEPITQEQADDLRSLIQQEAVNLEKFLEWAEVDRLEDVTARSFEVMCNQVRAIGAERRQRAGKK